MPKCQVQGTHVRMVSLISSPLRTKLGRKYQVSSHLLHSRVWGGIAWSVSRQLFREEGQQCSNKLGVEWDQGQSPYLRTEAGVHVVAPPGKSHRARDNVLAPWSVCASFSSPHNGDNEGTDS